ncbi:hypothetical protein RI543_002268 [Arxiozyma heterogenica]|uniref:Uncharacterized protein n=1 Tax=Arxiozyma heterogenica TaxID=278026 RepID=A0AAN7WTC6_9SACH|nr:hypothetical protein RI543_002268 [Kazachstania heterogenica]
MISYSDDQLYKDAVFSSKNNELKKSMSYWVPLMNKCFVRNSDKDNVDQAIVIDDTFYQNLPLVIEFLQSLFGYALEVNQNNIFAGNSEDDYEIDTEEEEEEEEEENIENENDEKHLKNTKFFQFGLKEDDEIDFTNEESNNQVIDSDDNNSISITDFNDFMKEGRAVFRLMIEFILSIINTKMNNTNDKTSLIKLYTILADCFKELDDIKNSLNYYNLALASCEQMNNTNLKISILLKITELIKWTDQPMEKSDYYFKIYKKSLIEAIKLIKSSKDDEYIPILPGLKEELHELKLQGSRTNDIRSLHPDFDNVLKRALGQISTDTIKIDNVNDLSNLIQKKKPKRK